MLRHVVFILFVLSFSCAAIAKTAALPNRAQKVANAWEMPSFFEQNKGQAAKDVLFQARTDDYLVLVKRDVFSVVPKASGAHPLTFHFIGSTPSESPQGVQPLRAKVNYFIGNNPKAWQQNIPTFSELRQSNVYPGIDLVYRFTAQGKLEYDFIVAPGADINLIRLQVEGSDQLSLNEQGALVLKTEQGPVEHQSPVVFQNIGGKNQPVAARYQLLAGNQLKISLDAYDQQHALVVDPVLEFSSYFGGLDRDSVRGVAWQEADDSLYITGGTSTQAIILTDDSYTSTNSGLLDATLEMSADQPQSAVEANSCVLNYDPARGNGTEQIYSAYDAFLAKIDLTTGQLLYASYYGGCANEQARDIALDKDGNVYIVGTTKSLDLPRNGISSELTPTSPNGDVYEVDAFVAKFDAAGQLVYGRYVGGAADDYGRAIAVDVDGYAYIVGNTSSRYMTSAQGYFTCFGRVTPDPEGDSCYMGQTDAFFARIHPSGTFVTHGTYIGGYGTDWAADLALSNSTGSNIEIYVAGTTASTSANPYSSDYKHDFPFKEDVRPYKYYVPGNCGDSGVDFINDKHPCRDAYVLVMNQMGENLLYTTMVGGAGDDVATGLAVDISKNIYLTGYSTSEGAVVQYGDPGNIENPKLIDGDLNKQVFIRFPLYNQVWDTQGLEPDVAFYDGISPKAFLTKFDAVSFYKDIQFSTFIGGSNVDKATGVVVSTTQSNEGDYIVKSNTIYLMGQTLSQDFTPLSGSFKSAADGEDVFLVKMVQQESANPSQIKNPRTLFGTLFGAEGLDAPKGMAHVVKAGVSQGVVIVGKSSSKRFPVTSDAFESSWPGGPDDGFVTYITDEALSTNLILKSAGYRLASKVGDAAEFAFEVVNEGDQAAEQVHLAISLPPSVTVTNRPGTCLLEDKRILFCELGTLDAAGAGVNSNSVNFGFVPQVGGTLRLRASVQSNMVDSDPDDNIFETEMTVEVEEFNAAHLNGLFILLLGLMTLIARHLHSPRTIH